MLLLNYDALAADRIEEGVSILVLVDVALEPNLMMPA